MISKKIKYICSEDPSLIENYDLAIADNTQTWHCHHRLEIDLNKSSKELIEIGLYYDRPASELKFMTPHDHNSLHNKGENNPMYGKKQPEEQKRKHSEFMRGEGNPMYNKNHTEDSKKKMSEIRIEYLSTHQHPRKR